MVVVVVDASHTVFQCSRTGTGIDRESSVEMGCVSRVKFGCNTASCGQSG